MSSWYSIPFPCYRTRIPHTRKNHDFG